METLSGYVIEAVLAEDEDTALLRAHDRHGRPVLIQSFKTAHPSPVEHQILRRELEATRLLGDGIAVQAVDIDTLGARPILVLRDQGGVPLARLMGQPMELG